MLTLITIGNTEVLGIILSIYNSALIASYMISIGCVLLHRLQGRELPHARYSLGRWGTVVNSIALIYVTPIFVFSFFPSAPNPTAATMNWASAMVGGIALLATFYYIIWSRRTYLPPNETVEDFIGRYEATTASSEKEVSGGTEKSVPEENVEAEK
jgi:hypothetical protein